MNKIPICRLCLQEKDFWGNFAIVYPETGLTQHKYCMARYSQNRRNLKKVIFKVKYQEYFGDMRQAGLVDIKAMSLLEEKTSKGKKESKKQRQEREKQKQQRLAYARECKELKRLEREEKIGELVKQHVDKLKPNFGDLIGETQIRESK